MRNTARRIFDGMLDRVSDATAPRVPWNLDVEVYGALVGGTSGDDPIQDPLHEALTACVTALRTPGRR